MRTTISPMELANQLPAERALTDSLIKEGRIRVVSTNNPATSPGKEGKEKPPKKERIKEPMELLRGKRVKLVLVNGTSLEGEVKEVSRFEVVLSTGGRSLVILKHAILCCEEVKACPSITASPLIASTT